MQNLQMLYYVGSYMGIHPTVPMTVYKVPNPLENISELYTIFADVLPAATDPAKRWVVNEVHGYWDEQEADPNEKKFKHRATTLSPAEPEHCVTIDEAWTLIHDRVRFHATSGFKYVRQLDMFGPPHKLYEVMSDGSYREMPLPEDS